MFGIDLGFSKKKESSTTNESFNKQGTEQLDLPDFFTGAQEGAIGLANQAIAPFKDNPITRTPAAGSNPQLGEAGLSSRIAFGLPDYMRSGTAAGIADGYTPMEAKAATASAASFDPSAITARLNPYIAQVIDPTRNEIMRSRTMAMNQAGDQAQAQSAYGGSRGAILEAETGRSYDDALARSIADLYAGGYGQALSSVENDLARQTQVAITNANAQSNASLANQRADLLGAELRLRGEGQFNNTVGAKQTGYLNAGQSLLNTGNNDRGIEQEQINASQPFNSADALQILLGALQGIGQTEKTVNTNESGTGTTTFKGKGTSFSAKGGFEW
jgi:hypothetical protein